MNKNVSLEGLPAVGKTTVLKKLKQLGFCVIEEIPDKYKNSKRKRIFKNIKEKVIYENMWYLKKEFQRLRPFLNKKDKILVLDRCIYSQIVHNYVHDKLYKTEGLPFLFNYLDSLKATDRKVLFTNVVYIDGTASFSIKNRIKRNKNNEKVKIFKNPTGWYSESFLAEIALAYKKILKVLPKKSVLVLSFPKDQKSFLKLIIDFINQNNKMEDIYKKLKKEFL